LHYVEILTHLWQGGSGFGREACMKKDERISQLEVGDIISLKGKEHPDDRLLRVVRIDHPNRVVHAVDVLSEDDSSTTEIPFDEVNVDDFIKAF
jgi:hypothetical protein